MQTVVLNGSTRYLVGASSSPQNGSGAVDAEELASFAAPAAARRFTSFDLSALRFSTNVGHPVGDTLVQDGTGSVGESVDLALLLLAGQDVRRGQVDGDDDDFAADAEWLTGEGDPSNELDPALAAAFAEEVDWRSTL